MYYFQKAEVGQNFHTTLFHKSSYSDQRLLSSRKAQTNQLQKTLHIVNFNFMEIYHPFLSFRILTAHGHSVCSAFVLY